jgi:hypothetical protein
MTCISKTLAATVSLAKLGVQLINTSVILSEIQGQPLNIGTNIFSLNLGQQDLNK